MYAYETRLSVWRTGIYRLGVIILAVLREHSGETSLVGTACHIVAPCQVSQTLDFGGARGTMMRRTHDPDGPEPGLT